MTAAAGLVPGQLRAVGLTIGAVYGFNTVRGILTELHVSGLDLVQELVNLIAWGPGMVALIAFIANRVRAGQLSLVMAGLSYPIAVALWPLVAVPGDQARVDFWIHQMPGLAAIALMVTVRLWIATAALVLYCLLVEAVMRWVGIVTDWGQTLVRGMFSIAYSAFFFVILLAMVRTMEGTNRVLDRSAREQAQAAVMQARADEIGRLDRLTHDFVLSLLSAAAEVVPADKLQIQAESVRRQLDSGFPESESDGTTAEVAERMARRSERRGVPVRVTGTAGRDLIPRDVAVEVEAAVDEAIRNLVRYASGAGRAEVTLGDGGLVARIIDDGPGFSLDQLGERLGIRHSILERMNSLPGGLATVDSAPGRGTLVSVSWRAP